MKAIAGVLVMLLAALPAPAARIAQKAKTNDKTPDYYPLKAGNKWHYQIDGGGGQKATVVYQVVKIKNVNGNPIAVVEQLINGEVRASEHIGVEAGGVFKYQYKGIDISPPVCLLKYPIKEGSTWETEPKIGSQQLTVSGRQSGIVEVKVPAGTYQAVSVKLETTVKESKVITTYWFAPDVGIIKESMGIPGGSINMELVKFEEGK